MLLLLPKVLTSPIIHRLDVEYVEAWPIKVDSSKGGVGEEFLSKFPTGKVPALERPNGFTLFECIPVALYRELFAETGLICDNGLLTHNN